MTVSEHCLYEAETCQKAARKADSKTIYDALMKDADLWERRAGNLTVEQGAMDVKDVVLWRLFDPEGVKAEKEESEPIHALANMAATLQDELDEVRSLLVGESYQIDELLSKLEDAQGSARGIADALSDIGWVD